MASTKSIFTDSVSFLVRDLLKEIAELSKTNPGPLTVEQMETHLGLPRQVARVIPVPAAPPMTAVMPRRTAVAAAAAAEIDGSGQACVHIFQRGPRRNMQCDKMAIPGEKYCKQCSRSVNNSKKPKSDSKTLKSIGLNLGAGRRDDDDDEEPEEERREVSAKKIPGSENMYCESRHNFVYHALSNGDLELIGRMENEILIGVSSQEIAVAEDEYGFISTLNTKRI